MGEYREMGLGHRLVVAGDELRLPDHAEAETVLWALDRPRTSPCLCPWVFRAWHGQEPGFEGSLLFELLPEGLQADLRRRWRALHQRAKRAPERR